MRNHALTRAIVFLTAAAAFVSSTFARDLTFEDRVKAQEAIERVYYSHQIGATKPFEEAVPREVIEKKVTTYLELSSRKDITQTELRREWDRIEANTRMPERLNEIFAALGNNPLVIEECLVRPLLVARALSSDAAPVETENRSTRTNAPTDACIADSWTPVAASGAPSARAGHAAVWTGSVMLVWGGYASSSGSAGDGSRYDPALDAWQALSTSGAPSARSAHTAVWTGARMVVWGGQDVAGRKFNTGGRYDPTSDTWTATSELNAPTGRSRHSAVWTGNVMVVWGGLGVPGPCGTDYLGDGSRYDPSTDTWTATNLTGAPSGRLSPVVAWTGTEMLVWGGSTAISFPPNPCGPAYLGGGARYDPVADTWNPMSTSGAPTNRSSFVAVWTGSKWFVWGGNTEVGLSAIGAGYDPVFNAWSPMRTTDAPTPRSGASGVWSGSEMIVWGGGDAGGPLHSGGMYDPVRDRWTPTTLAGAPQARSGPTAVWDGSSMIVWGGWTGSAYFADGARYDPGNSDNDGDGACRDQDNCSVAANAVQRDSDADGLGDLCDNCPQAANADQADGDGDGAGDVCDCQPSDPNDRMPAEVRSLFVDKTETSATVSWSIVPDAEAYSVTRGELAAIGANQYGSCLANGLVSPSHDDAALPAPGEGFYYLVQAQNFDCGLGPLGRTSLEEQRSNASAGACTGTAVHDAHASGQSTVYGTVVGTLADTLSSNNAYEAITEVLSTGAPGSIYSRLEHRWTFVVDAGSLTELHVEGFRSPAGDNDSFRFEYSTNGTTFRPTTLSLPLYTDDNIDRIATLPVSFSGTMTIRVVDTDRTAGNQALDTVTIDELWIRSVP